MNVLPLLLAAIAVLLSAGAFLLALRSPRAGKDPDASARDLALREDVARIGRRLDDIGDAVAGVPATLETLGGGLSSLPSALASSSAALADSLAALPARIAQASGSTDSLAASHAVRDASLKAIDRLDAIRGELQSSASAQVAVLRDLGAALAGLERSAGQNLSTSRESAEGLAAALSAAAERSASGAAVQAETLQAISGTLSELVGLVGSTVEQLADTTRGDLLARQLDVLQQSNELVRANGAGIASATEVLERIASGQAAALERDARGVGAAQEAGNASRELLQAALENLAEESAKTRQILEILPVRTAEEIATRPAPAPELEELAIAVRDAGALRGDSVRSIADAVSRVADRLEASAEEGRSAREDAAERLSQSLTTLESVAAGVREALLPLGEALRGHGEAVVPVVKGLESAQDRFEEAAVSLRVNQVEFAASVGVFTSAAQDLSTGLGAFAREGLEDSSKDPAAVQQALLESLDRLLGGFSDSLRATLVEADLRHREALVEIAARLPDGTKG